MQLFRTKRNKQTTSLPRREKYTISKPERENVTDRKHFEGRVGLYERPLILPEFGLVEGHEAEVEAGEETRETQNDHKDEKGVDDL